MALLTSLGIQGNLEEFVQLIDGYPLLLQFVADLLKEEYPQDPNLKRLESLGLGNLKQLLTDKKVVGVHRRENVGMVLVLDASFGRLSDFQKSLLQNISVYRGAVNAKAASYVCPGSSETEIEQELRNLVRRSFLSEKLIDDCRWFEFQPVVLEYVRYKAGNQTEAHQQAINYYQLIAKQSGWQTKDDIQEYLEIFYHFYQLEDYDSAFDAIHYCDDFLTLRGYYANQVELYGQLVSQWAEIGVRKNWNHRASLTSLGNAYKSMGQYERAIKFLQQSLDIAIDIGDQTGEGISLKSLGLTYHELSQYERAIELHQQSLKIFREIGDRKGEGDSLNNLGLAYCFLGESQKAIEFLQQSLEICKEIKDRLGEGSTLINLGLAFNKLGQYERAIEFYQQSLNITREIGHRLDESISLLGLGNAYNDLGQYQKAIDFHQQSLDISREIGDVQGESFSLNNLGNAYNDLGQYQKAIDCHQQSLEIAREIGSVGGESNSLNGLGNAYQSMGKYQQAIEYLQDSLTIARDIGDIEEEAKTWFNLGLVLEKVDREADALGAYRNACGLYETMGLDANVQNCNDAINRLSQPRKPVVSRRDFWGWLRRLWRWVRGWFR